LALGVSSVLVVSGLGSPAGAQGPTAVADCTMGSSFPELPELSGRFTDFPPNDSFLLFVLVENGDGDTSVNQGYRIFTDGNGDGGSTPALPFSPLPLKVSVAVYRDLNGNRQWDPGVDDTVYRGDGTVTSCPSTVTLSPK